MCSRLRLVGPLVVACLVTAPVALAAKTVTIKYMNWDAGTANAKYQQRVIAEFEKTNPGIKVEMVSGPWANPEKLLLMLSAGTPPDVIWPTSIEMSWYVQNNILLDLTPFQKQNPVSTDWFKAWNRSVYTDKKLYAIPMDTAAYQVFYNKDLLNNAGVVLSDDTWTWADYTAISAKLSKVEDNVFSQIGGQLPFGWFGWGCLRSFGGAVVADGGKDTGIDSPGSLKAYQWMRNFVSTTMSGQYRRGDAARGKLATWFDGNWSLEANTKILKFNYDVALWPKGPEGRYVTMTNTNWAIPKASKHPKEAWRFIRFLAGDWASNFFGENRIFPARPKFVKSAGSGLSDASFRRVFVDQLEESGYVETPAPWLPQARVDMDGERINLWNQVWGFKRELRDIADSAAKAVRTNYIKRYLKK